VLGTDELVCVVLEPLRHHQMATQVSKIRIKAMRNWITPSTFNVSRQEIVLNQKGNKTVTDAGVKEARRGLCSERMVTHAPHKQTISGSLNRVAVEAHYHVSALKNAP
jgi:hypothetical protein